MACAQLMKAIESRRLAKSVAASSITAFWADGAAVVVTVIVRFPGDQWALYRARGSRHIRLVQGRPAHRGAPSSRLLVCSLLSRLAGSLARSLAGSRRSL